MTSSNQTLGIDLQNWIGQRDCAVDTISAQKVREFEATFESGLFSGSFNNAPQLIHWCLAKSTPARSDLNVDGHEKRGRFLPPIALPRRMWAAGDVEFHHPLLVGEPITRVSQIRSISRKTGGAGDLYFIDVSHSINSASAVCIEEVQTLVFRGETALRPPGQVPTIGQDEADLVEPIEFSSIDLFRYSALTFNSHRIHFDRAYAQNFEGYDGLVVQGPLQATILAHLASRATGRELAGFRYRAIAPLYAEERAQIRFKKTNDVLAACFCNSSGLATMEATFR